jgi:hypothetical protein
MDSKKAIETIGAVNPMTSDETSLEVLSGLTPQKEDLVNDQETVYEFHFNPKCEVTGDTAVDVAARAEEVAAYLAALAAEPEIDAEPDGNQGMIYRTSNRRVAARFNFPEMRLGDEEEPKEPGYTTDDRRPVADSIAVTAEYRTWSCRAEFSVDLAEILLRLHNHPKFGALLGYRANKMQGAPMLEITTTLTRDEILDAFASTYDTHVMAQSLRPVSLEENDGERDYAVEFPETHCRLPRPGRLSLMDRFLHEYPFAFDNANSLMTPPGITTALRRADSDAEGSRLDSPGSHEGES